MKESHPDSPCVSRGDHRFSHSSTLTVKVIAPIAFAPCTTGTEIWTELVAVLSSNASVPY